MVDYLPNLSKTMTSVPRTNETKSPHKDACDLRTIRRNNSLSHVTCGRERVHFTVYI